MKTIISKSLLIITASLLLQFKTKANNNTNPKVVELSSTSTFIKEHVTFPNIIFNFNKEVLVTVVFTVDEQGKVNLVIANTKNEFLKTAIESKFSLLVLSNLKANNTYSIDFKFKNQ